MKIVKEYLNEIKRNQEGSGLGVIGIGKVALNRGYREIKKINSHLQGGRPGLQGGPMDQFSSICNNSVRDIVGNILNTTPDNIHFFYTNSALQFSQEEQRYILDIFSPGPNVNVSYHPVLVKSLYNEDEPTIDVPVNGKFIYNSYLNAVCVEYKDLRNRKFVNICFRIN